MVDLSIIIPVYNGEKYIERCINNIKNDNAEIIIINDGSTDKSDKIIKSLIKDSKNIKYLKIQNHGVSYARNLGINNANGRYIMFCDCDDSYSKDTVDKVLDLIKKNDYDLIEFNRVNVANDKIISDYLFGKEEYYINRKEYLINEFSKTRHSCYSVVNKVYNRELINEDNIKFDEKLKISEDLIFNLLYLKKCNNIFKYGKVEYIRYCNDGSAIYRKIDNFFDLNVKLINKYKKEIDREVYNSLIIHYAFTAYDRYFDRIDSKKLSDTIKNINKIKKFCKSNQLRMVDKSNKKFTLFSVFRWLPSGIFAFIIQSIYDLKKGMKYENK